LQGNEQRTYQIPTQNIPRTFRIFPADLTKIYLAQEMFRTFTVYPGDFLIRKYVGKFKMFPKNVPTVFLGGLFKVFFAMSPVKKPQFIEPVKFKMCRSNVTKMFQSGIFRMP
jgi:hypothetical protein